MKFIVESREFVGETMLDMPVFRAIARKGHHLEVVVAEHCASMLEDCPYISAVHVRTKNANWVGRYNMYRTATSQGCDVYLGYRPQVIYRILKLCSRTNAWRHRGYIESSTQANCTILSRLAALDGLIDGWNQEIDTTLPLKCIRYANAYRIAKIAHPSDNYLTVAPGASHASKRWPWQNFAEVVRNIRHKYTNVVIVGSPAEYDLCEKIAIETNSVSVAGMLNLIDTCALVSSAKQHIGNDSGLGHVAAGNGVRVLAIGGRTDGYYTPWRQSMLCGNVDCIDVSKVLSALSSAI